MERLGWEQCDCIIVTGDAFVDHPSFGAAVICRVLLAAGFRTGVIAQPDWKTDNDFLALGRPRLFFGVTSGNVDSMVANYSPNFRPRRKDDFSPGGRAGMRPDRAVTTYANKLRQLHKGVPLVVGGIEASLRRLAHYDCWDDAVRGSVLLDARADVLVYGMGERQVVELARRLARSGEPGAAHGTPQPALLSGIPGTCVAAKGPPAEEHVLLPSLDEVRQDGEAFNRAFRLWHRETVDPQGMPVVQQHGDRYVVQYPVPRPMSSEELDHVYDLPYARQAHPCYREPIPALETIRFSITSHRGCFGSCSFCSLQAHQGRIIQWRSPGSIVREAEKTAALPGFRGHITDVGGPTANMYAATCSKMGKGSVCRERECTFPGKCPNLETPYERQLQVLEAVSRVKGVKKVSIGSGIRFDLIEGKAGEKYLGQLCRLYVSGQMRVAPEHIVPRVLAAMRKFPPGSYDSFRRRFLKLARSSGGPRLYLIPYYISGHPGATLDDAVALAEYLVKVERFLIRQVQQFTPLPMTAAGAAYHTGKDPLTNQPLHVAKDAKEKRLQRALLQLQEPGNYRYAEQQLLNLGRKDLVERIRRLKPFFRTAGRWRGSS